MPDFQTAASASGTQNPSRWAAIAAIIAVAGTAAVYPRDALTPAFWLSAAAAHPVTVAIAALAVAAVAAAALGMVSDLAQARSMGRKTMAITLAMTLLAIAPMLLRQLPTNVVDPAAAPADGRAALTAELAGALDGAMNATALLLVVIALLLGAFACWTGSPQVTRPQEPT